MPTNMTMMVAAAVFLLCTGVVAAEDQQPQAYPQPPLLRIPTKITTAKISLEALLNGGAQIVSGGLGSFVLRREAEGHTQWISCELQDGRMNGGGPTSLCYLLNPR